MPSLFRRKPAAAESDEAATAVVGEPAVEAARTKGYTPAKGQKTPKRPSEQRRRVAATPLSKEEQRAARREAAADFRTEGGPRDRGPERKLVRDVIDSRRTVGSFFLGGMVLILVASTGAMPLIVQYLATLAMPALTLAVIVDSVFIARKIKRMVRERFPKTTERMGSLYYYGITRGLSFRRMRLPKPAVRPGDAI